MDPATLAATLSAFLLAGTVKGVIGLGLPPVSLALMILVLELPEAMAVLIVPSLVTNLWQALSGGGTAALARRLAPFLVPAGLFVPVGALALTRIDLPLLSALLGIVLTIYAASGLAGLRLALDARRERWAAPLAGVMSGTLAGMTGSFSVPTVLYLQAIGLTRDEMVQALGVVFTILTVALALALGGSGLATPALWALSALSVLPALAGMVLGRRLRHALPERVFRPVFFSALLALGLYIAASSLL